MGILTECAKNNGRSNSLDALRASLALWVLIAHAMPWIESLEGGGSVPRVGLFLTSVVGTLTQSSWELNPAVLAFIVLSGYCIHRTGFRKDQNVILVYGIRRAARILPIFYAALFFSIFIGAFDTQKPSLSCIIAHATSLSALTSQFAACPLGNLPLGTVKVEILLYALYALAFWLLAWRGRERWIWVGCGIVCLLDLIVAARARSDFSFYYWWQNWSLLGFFSYWWLGAAFVNPAVGEWMSRRALYLLGCYGLMTAAILFFTPAVLTFQPYSPHDVPAFVFILAELRKFVLAVLVGVLIVRLENIRLRNWNPFSALGRASYSLYALHTPITFALCIMNVPWSLIIVGNVGVAFASYHFVERPGIALGRMFLLKRTVPAQAPPRLRSDRRRREEHRFGESIFGGGSSPH